MNHQAAIIREAALQGKDPSELSKVQYRVLSLKIRTAQEIREDGIAMAMGNFNSAIGRKIVPEEVRESNLVICRMNICGSYGHIDGGSTEVCHRCNCIGRNLTIKAEQESESCPAGLWDNSKLTVKGKAI